MTGKRWADQEIEKIKAGGEMRLRCTMAFPERVTAGICLGDVPVDRIKRGADTCSQECAADRKRIRRWFLSTRKCRVCGHGFTKKEREAMLRAHESPESGQEE